MMLENITTVIFDMDGTLIDSMWIWPKVDEKFFEKEKIRLPKNLQKEIEGLSMHDTARYFLDNFPISYEVEELISLWNSMAEYEYQNEVDYKPGALHFLKELKRLGIKTGIATSNSRELVEAADKTLQFSKYIDCIVTSKEVPNGKPAPDIYLKVAGELGAKPENCLVFEDIPNGILAAKRANMRTCAIHDEFSKDLETEKRQLAEHYIFSYDEISLE